MSEELEERVRRLEREVRRLKMSLSSSRGEVEPLREEDGVRLFEAGDMFGSYVVVDRDGTTHHYGSLRDAERTFKKLVERKEQV